MKAQMHRINIPEILEVGTSKMVRSGEFIQRKGFKKGVLFLGEGIKELFGKMLLPSFEEATDFKILSMYEYDDINIEKIVNEAFKLPKETEVVIAAGGGKVLDAAKYIAFLNDIPFVSIPTSTAHDGFASSGCSLIVGGRRTSVHARMPYGIIVDIGIVKSSPVKFIYSGLGDIISKITAVYDWKFEEDNGRGHVNDFAVMIAKKSVNSIVRMPYEDIREEFFLKELVDSLTMSGIAMEISGSSAPASGSEHLISHALDKLLLKPEPHGIQVGIATYIMSLVQGYRTERIIKFLSGTGFFSFAETLGLKAEDYERAIELAPTIKPDRYTYIHIEKNRAEAKRLLHEDEILKKIFS